MALTSGTRLGPYEISALIGAGGMGEVYQATDTNLKRQVAIKVLPEAVAADAERLARFQREAELLAALNHPHIAQIHGLEKSDGQTALVMELVEGPTLADRIAQGAIPVDEALPIARQIAEALDAAHEQGIIHRDLKPANIKVRPDGTVKVLDFGLAKAMEPSGVSYVAGLGLTQSPTITTPAMTMAGVILGTAAYMSPEQAKGRPADRRSDVWAFGAVLFEMLTGKRAFDGDDMVDVLGAVARLEPAWGLLPTDTPALVRVLLQSCLIKDRLQRVTDMSAALFALSKAHDLSERPAASTDPNPASGHQPSSWRLAVVGVAALLVGAAVAGALTFFITRPASPRVAYFPMAPAGAWRLATTGGSQTLTVTPDGRQLVYIATNNRQLLVRDFDQLAPTVIANGTALGSVFISPDGQWVGFVDDLSSVKKVAITGGPVTTIADVGSGSYGATWATDGWIIFATNQTATGLLRVSTAGGEVTEITRPEPERDHAWPEMVPGGQAVLFTILPSTGNLEDAELAVLDIASGEQKVLLKGGTHARYVPTGHLVYVTGNELRAVGFDLGRLELRGTPSLVLTGLGTTQSGSGNFAFSSDGTLVYADTTGLPSPSARTIVWVDRQGREEPLPAPVRAYAHPRVSPDGTRVLFAIEGDIWMWDATRETLTRLTFDRRVEFFPLWMPDGQAIVFGGEILGRQGIDSSGPEELLAVDKKSGQPTDISPDGKTVIMYEVTQDSGRNLIAIPLDRERTVQPLLRGRADERNGTVSPGGRWLAYESDESGRFEIYVRPFTAEASRQWQVSMTGGTRPLWSRSGEELFFLAADGAVMGVRVDEQTPAWSASDSSRVVEARYFHPAGDFSRSYDVSPDGRRFLMIKQAEGDASLGPPRIVVALNWFEELKRLAQID